VRQVEACSELARGGLWMVPISTVGKNIVKSRLVFFLHVVEKNLLQVCKKVSVHDFLNRKEIIAKKFRCGEEKGERKRCLK
jgi:hypothetical protein